MTKISKLELTQEKVKEYLEYNPANGFLTWIKRPSKKVHKNSRAGFLRKSGYRGITLFGTSYIEHHIIWFYVHGYWADEIDHINHVKDDNSLSNLRAVTHAENSRNMKKLKNTITGEQGIYYDRKKDRYTATIRQQGKVVFSLSCGSEDVDQLIETRKAKLLELGFHENHGE